eukprot:m.61815 g.61815  ORF g.61815 m.61815 type:complete len:83 (-) comp11450_c0_seq1:48-296(-)
MTMYLKYDQGARSKMFTILALCKQMTAMMLNEWERNRHICENFYPNNTKNAVHTDCSGTKFYHWGALTGMISLVEEGYYKDV